MARELYESFIRSRGFALALLTILLSIAGFYFDPDISIPVKWLIPITLLVSCVLFVVIDFGVRAYGRSRKALPNVLLIQHPAAKGDGRVLLLLEPSDLFGHGMVVSVYRVTEGLEILIGIGHVNNIQQNSMIQIAVDSIIPGQEQLWRQMTANVAEFRKSLLVKPSAQRWLLAGGGE